VEKMIFNSKMGVTRTLVIGFALIIFVGSILLFLPISNRTGHISYIDALFTSTSAVCVTGLSVADTWTQFTLFGQIVILALIQIGGLGFMTIAIEFALFSGKRIGLRERSMLDDAVNATQIGGVVRLIRRILIGTAIIESSGALILSFRFIPRFGVARGIWFSIFHSISAFCNAGFDLMGILKPNSSLTLFTNDPVVIITIALLIIVGGIGFIVWNDLIDVKFKFQKLKLHSRIAITYTISIIFIGMLLFFLMEQNNVLKGKPLSEQLLISFFQSVTPRTAGYFAVDIGKLGDPSRYLTIFLMIIGACPGGTGGGIKITTFAVICRAVHAYIYDSDNVSLMHYRVSDETIHRAFNSTALYLLFGILGTWTICLQGNTFTAAAVECFSAIGTVGLSNGITSSLSALGLIVLIVLMYMGRLGSLTVFTAMKRNGSTNKLKDPLGSVIVG
jgi:trk system potassium uptake protein TrkH